MKSKPPTFPIVYVHWLDANYMEGPQELATLDWKADLEYIGWLVKETPEAITLSLEKPVEGKTRNTFTILRRTVVEMYEISGKRRRVTAATVPADGGPHPPADDKVE